MKKKILNNNLERAIYLRKRLENEAEMEKRVMNLPSVELLQSLLKEYGGNENRVYQIAKETSGVVDATSFHEMAAKEDDIQQQYDTFRRLMKDNLSIEELEIIWIRALDNSRDVSSLMPTAMDIIFHDENILRSQKEELESQDKYKFTKQSAQEAALAVLVDIFGPDDENRMRVVLKECQYDTEEATSRILKLSESGWLDEDKYPELGSDKSTKKTKNKPEYYIDCGTSPRSKSSAPTRLVSNHVVASSRSGPVEEVRVATSSNDEEYWRHLAANEHRLMSLKYQEAAAKYRNNRAAAAYSSSEAADHQRKMQEASTQAALCALQANNPALVIAIDTCGCLMFCGPAGQSAVCIDLHRVTVKDALEIVESCLRRYMRTSSTVSFITGVGVHSGAAGPRLGPALGAYLHNNRFSFIQDDGRFIVTMPK